MYILVDFDNLDKGFKRKGVEHIANHIVRQFDSDYLAPHSELTMRLYGGWYESKKPTRMAQDLVIEIQKVSPIIFKYKHFGEYKPIKLRIELAYSLVC
ncbi:hypothetical protein P4E94_11080 [Pontiellaceae bacterium B12219]|nr:hypothetical protein [Pontiellaceae bacterium B12219]